MHFIEVKTSTKCSGFVIQWNLYEADTFRTFPSVRLKEVCAMFVLTKFVKINIQKLLCTVIKFHEVPYFEQDF